MKLLRARVDMFLAAGRIVMVFRLLTLIAVGFSAAIILG